MQKTRIAPGSQGDVRPYVALGRGLQAAGHTVLVAAHLNFAPLVTGCGLAFSPLHGDKENYNCIIVHTARGRGEAVL